MLVTSISNEYNTKALEYKDFSFKTIDVVSTFNAAHRTLPELYPPARFARAGGTLYGDTSIGPIPLAPLFFVLRQRPEPLLLEQIISSFELL